jgi:hypothetical protein
VDRRSRLPQLPPPHSPDRVVVVSSTPNSELQNVGLTIATPSMANQGFLNDKTPTHMSCQQANVRPALLANNQNHVEANLHFIILDDLVELFQI